MTDNKTANAKSENIKKRQYLNELEGQIGKTYIVNKTAGVAGDGGYYCDICDCALKDSLNFLDHINGRKHQKNLGLKLTVERSTLDQVKNRLADIKKKKEEEKNKIITEYDLDEKITADRQMFKEKMKLIKQEKKDRKRKFEEEQEETEKDLENVEMMEMMGFANFGSKKK